jgi:hypothetical protein
MKANRALCAVRLIKKYFNGDELRTLLTSNFFSVRYYNSEIWHLQSLNQHSKQLLIAASAKALKLCFKSQPVLFSYNDIHTLTKRATPPQLQTYKHAILLFRLYNSINATSDWVRLNFQQTLTSRQMNFIITQTNNFKSETT